MNLEELTAKEITAYLNTLLADLTISDVDDKVVRRTMIKHIKNKLPKYHIPETRHSGTEFVILIGEFCVLFKTGVKNTDEIKQITKLRSSYVKVPNKIKFDHISHRIQLPCFEWNDVSHVYSGGNEMIQSKKSYLYCSDLIIENPDIKIKEIDTNFLMETYQKRSGKSLKQEMNESVTSNHIIHFKAYQKNSNVFVPDDLKKDFEAYLETKNYPDLYKAVSLYCATKYNDLYESLYQYCFSK